MYTCCILVYKEAFSAYDKQKNGTIRIKALIKVLRTLGENPTEDVIERVELELAAKKGENLFFLQFQLFVSIY